MLKTEMIKVCSALAAALAIVGCGGNMNGSTMLSKSLASNASVPTCTNPAMAPSYAATIQPIVTSYCVSCHTNFSTYAGASPNATLMALEVRTLAMPPVITTITSIDRMNIEQWAACGTKP